MAEAEAPIGCEVENGKMQDVHRTNMVSIGAVGGSIAAAGALCACCEDISFDFLVKALVGVMVEPPSQDGRTDMCRKKLFLDGAK